MKKAILIAVLLAATASGAMAQNAVRAESASVRQQLPARTNAGVRPAASVEASNQVISPATTPAAAQVQRQNVSATEAPRRVATPQTMESPAPVLSAGKARRFSNDGAAKR